MADRKDILGGALGRFADRVREAADPGSVRDVYARGAERAKAFGQLTKLSVELRGEHEELNRVYAEIGRLCYEQMREAPEGLCAPLFEQVGRITRSIREKREKIEELKGSFEPGESDIDVEIGEFEDVVSATEADGMTVELGSEDGKE